MPRFRRVISSLLFILLVSAVTADAGPILYTDRDAFNQAVGASTVVTFDQAQPCTYDFVRRTCTVTYDNLVTFTFDAVGGVGVMPDYITMGRSGLAASARVLAPVTAFGFDVISAGQGLVPVRGSVVPVERPAVLRHRFGRAVRAAIRLREPRVYRPVLDRQFGRQDRTRASDPPVGGPRMRRRCAAAQTSQGATSAVAFGVARRL